MAVTALPLDAMVEVALGADLTAAEHTWSWTELTYEGTSRVLVRQPVTISRGQADYRSGIEPAAIQMLLRNPDGELTPRRAASSISPYFRRGCPLRFSLTNVGLPHLLTTGASTSRAGTVDHADFPTGDWFVGVEVEAPFHFPPAGTTYEIAGKFNNTGNQRSFLLYMASDGALRIRSSTDGAAEVNSVGLTPLPRPITGTMAFAVWYDVASGANRVMTVYSASTLAEILADPAGTVLETITDAGTTSVFNSTATFDVGDVTGSGFSPFPGRFRKVQVRAGDSTGTIVTNPDFTIQTPGVTSFADTAPTPKTWTVGALGTIERKQIRFLGQITDIKPAWPEGDNSGLAVVSVEAAGVLQRFQRLEGPIESAIYRTVTAPQHADNIHAYFPLEDGRDATEVFSPIGGEPGGVLTASLASDDSLPGSDSLPSVSGGQAYGWNLTFPPLAPKAGWSAHWFVNLATLPVGAEILDQRIDTLGGTTTQWVLRLDSGGFFIYAKDTADPPANVLSASFGPLDIYGQWVMITLTLAQAGANITYGVTFTAQGGSYGGAGGTLVGYTLGSPWRFRSLDDNAPGDGFSIGHFIISSGLTSTFLIPADTGYLGETAGSRIARLCTEQQIPYVIAGDADASEPMGPQRPIKFTELLSECRDADLGVLVELPNTIGVGYRCRNDLINQSPALTVADDKNLDVSFGAVEDDQRLVNDFTATRTNGSSFHATDDAHIAAEDRYPGAGEVNVAYDWQLPSYAGRRLAEGTVEEMRYPQVDVNLVSDSAMHDAWLNADVGDIVEITGLPDEHPTSTANVILEGYTETVSAAEWDLRLDNGPGSPFTAGVADTDRADTEGSELAVAVNSSATSWSVATTAWPPWRSTAGGASFPYDLDAGGEEVAVSAVADIAATFGAVGTVTHGVNASVTPGAPAGVVAGNLLLILAAIRNLGAGTVNVPSGWTRLPLFEATDNVALLGRIAQANGEAMPLVTFSGGVANADTSAQCARFGGTYYDVSNLPVTWGRVGSISAQDIAYPATRSPYDNSLVLYCGWKSDDWTSVATIAGATEIGEPDTTTGDDQGLVWDYLIQTTAANIAAGSFVVTGGAAGVTLGGVIVLRPDVQTFTVARSANGVEKSHAAGADVALADPMTSA
jgi:hypothetical protein